MAQSLVAIVIYNGQPMKVVDVIRSVMAGDGGNLPNLQIGLRIDGPL
jgi:hypothetical protein